MKQRKIYEDGTAELILLRVLLPWVSVVWVIAATVYFTGLLPKNDALGYAEYRMLRILTYVGSVGIVLATLVVAAARPPRVRLRRLWIALSLCGAALSVAGVTTYFWLIGK
ncbi:hypothetical protein G3O06_05370 [Burkholderia sp. Ac-20345]|uniref:hypothetical protein n=1 Tax=Burkholderia sp. Ac-20345 TaxID=2703891 RepID=UPI00197BB760|nr:hypothetical protein [Burkholderia sp. Ac-20345]MBN3776999.1 hypothetical protein [Burkholderia sp. Ac-20345]